MEGSLLRNGAIIRQADLMMISSDAGAVCPVRDWLVDAFRDIAARLNDRDFSCLFARHAWKSETLLFGLVSEDMHSNTLPNQCWKRMIDEPVYVLYRW